MEKLDLEKLKNININDISLNELIDIQDIKIDENLSKDNRLIQFLNQIKNPYCFKYKNYKVKIVFNEDENSPTLEECLNRYIQNL